MAKFADLVKGFRSNVRHGIPSTLIYTGEVVHLTAERKNGLVGICGRPGPKNEPKGGK